MITQLETNMMQATAAEIARNAETGRRSAGVAGERRRGRRIGRAQHGWARLSPVLRHI